MHATEGDTSSIAARHDSLLGSRVKGLRVTVMGLGRFGGGVGVVRHMVRNGARVTVTDLDTADKLHDSLRAIGDELGHGAITLKLGGHDAQDFVESDLIVANPAVPRPWQNTYLRAAEAAGVPITTEIALAIGELLARGNSVGTVAITGSVGKSTTTAMITHALRSTGVRVLMGGNIGGSLLGSLEQLAAKSIVVLELSSAQLYWLSRDAGPARAWAPRVGVLTSFSENHLDWHETLDHYARSKAQLFLHQCEGDTAILADDVQSWRSRIAPGAAIGPKLALPAPASLFPEALALPGAHNLANARLALAACKAIAPHIDEDALAHALAKFPGLAHRLQLVATVNGVRYYNDSKSTTPESTLTALHAVCELPGVSAAKVHLIAGGYDKKSDLSPISSISPALAGLYTIGATGPALARAAQANAHDCGTIEHAFASIHPTPGDVVLLSPACASWDQFTNFEQRGEAFSRLVHARAEGLL